MVLTGDSVGGGVAFIRLYLLKASVFVFSTMTNFSSLSFSFVWKTIVKKFMQGMASLASSLFFLGFNDLRTCVI